LRAQGDERRLVSLRVELLPALPAGGPQGATDFLATVIEIGNQPVQFKSGRATGRGVLLRVR
jgi:hypothetical protein